MAENDKHPDNQDLSSIRERIDAVDARIQSLINERARLAQQVGISKGELASAVDYYRPEREAEVLRKIRARNEGPLRDDEMQRLFREIMSACLAQQEPLKVGFLGPEGTFTQTAVYKQFGHSVRALPFHTIDEIFHEVESGVADFGVVPIENSTEGSVNYTLDMFLTSPLKIAGEIELRIEQHLLGSESGLDKIERICAHEQSLAQCRGWLREYLPHVELIGMSSNAAGARRAPADRLAASAACCTRSTMASGSQRDSLENNCGSTACAAAATGSWWSRIARYCARASASVSRQMTCGLMMVRMSRPLARARDLMRSLWAGSAAQALSRSAPAGLVMKIRSECRVAYSSPAPDEAALTSRQRPLTGLGATKAFFVRHHAPSKVSSSSSSHNRSSSVVNSSAIS